MCVCCVTVLAAGAGEDIILHILTYALCEYIPDSSDMSDISDMSEMSHMYHLSDMS